MNPASGSIEAPLPARMVLVQWSLVPLLLLLACIGVAQVSNAVNPINLVQKPGNQLDDAYLSNALARSGSFGEVRTHIKHERNLTWPAWVQYEYFGFRSLGRRLVSAVLLTAGLGYLLFVLLRFRVVGTGGALALLVLLGCSEEFAVYASTGLTSYPLLLLLGMVALHQLFAHYGDELDWGAVARLALVFSACTFVGYRHIVMVYAVAAALVFGMPRSGWRAPGGVARRCLRVACMLAPPTVIALAWMVLDTPPELLNPQRGFDYYFFASGYEQSVPGGIRFYADRTWQLFQAAMGLHPYLVGPGAERAYLLLAGLLFLAGAVLSLRRPAGAVLLCLLAGLLANIVLNLASLVPYGNLRYVISFQPLFPLLAAIGASVLLEAGLRALGKFRPVVAHGALGLLFVLVGLVTSMYMARAVVQNTAGARKVSSGLAVAASMARNFDAALVVDTWTRETIADDAPRFPQSGAWVLNTQIKTSWAGKDPAELDDVAGWRQFVAAHDTIVMVTSLSLTPQHHGVLYEEISKRHDIVERSSNRTYHFTLLRARTPAGHGPG